MDLSVILLFLVKTTRMKTTFFTAAVLLAAIGFSCSSENTEEKKVEEQLNGTEQTSSDVKPDEQQEAVAPKSIGLKGKFLKEDEYGSRLYAVLLTVDGKTTAIDTVYACEAIPASSFSQYDIPKEAKSACGGWWAGAGDYFYATLEKNKVVVYQGWQDEQQEDEGYHWKALKLN